jgi:hypothetical protein
VHKPLQEEYFSLVNCSCLRRCCLTSDHETLKLSSGFVQEKKKKKEFVVEILLVTLQSGLKSTFNKLQALKKKWMPQPTISTSTSPKPQASTLPITHLPTNPNTIKLITPKLRITILSSPTQHKIPIIQLSSRNTRSLRKSHTITSWIGHEIFIAIRRNPSLSWSWCCYFCTRGFLCRG